MAFASRQVRGRRWRNWWRWRASSSATNSSSSRGLTIRCRTMTAIHRSGRCDKRDKESRRGCRMEPFRSLPLREHRLGQGSRRKPLRSEGEGRQCATMSPDIRIAAPHCYTYRTESPLHSEFVGRPPATLEKRIPINLQQMRCWMGTFHHRNRRARRNVGQGNNSRKRCRSRWLIHSRRSRSRDDIAVSLAVSCGTQHHAVAFATTHEQRQRVLRIAIQNLEVRTRVARSANDFR